MKKKTVDIVSSIIWILAFIIFTYSLNNGLSFLGISTCFLLCLVVIALNLYGINTKFSNEEKIRRIKDIRFLGFIFIFLLVLWLIKNM